MIARAFFDWMASQWWSQPAFMLLIVATLAIGGYAIALARPRSD